MLCVHHPRSQSYAIAHCTCNCCIVYHLPLCFPGPGSSSVGSVPWAHAFALLHDDDSVVHAGAWDGSLSLVSLSSGEVVQRVQHHTRPIRCVSLSADGQVLVCGSDDCTVSVWRVALRAGGGGLGGGAVEDMVSADAAARSVGDGMGSGGGAGGGVGGGAGTWEW